MVDVREIAVQQAINHAHQVMQEYQTFQKIVTEEAITLLGETK
jgi:hypothetical protein